MDKCNLDLIMLSRFGPSDGGMETWAYGFIPLLLASDKNINLRIYGIQEKGQANNTKYILEAINPSDRNRVDITLFPCKKSRIPYFFQMFFQMKRADHSKHADIVLGVGGVFELIMLRFMKKYKKSKKLLWFRTIFFNEKAYRFPKFILPLLRQLEIALLKKIGVLIANGTDIANYYKKHGLEVTVIPNGVDMEKWKAPLPKLQLPISVAFIGRLDKVKGISEFIEVVRIIKSSSMAENFVFHVIGHGLFEREVQVLAGEHKLIFHGVVANTEIPNMLAHYDICVALTWSKKSGGGGGTSNALLEQMASGRVIIAWDNVIFRQLLDENSCYFVAQGDIKGIIDSIYHVAKDKSLAQSKALAAKNVISCYSLDEQIQKFSDLCFHTK